jgi:hypothetical protein
MPTALLAPILSAIVGILLPALKDLVRTLQKNSKGEKFFASPIGKALLKSLDLDKPKDSPDLLFAELTEASQKMDGIVSRIQEYTKGRELSVKQLEAQLSQLTQQEEETKRRIQILNQTPVDVVPIMEAMLKKREKSSSIRDYALFIAGVVVSAIVTVILKHYGLA